MWQFKEPAISHDWFNFVMWPWYRGGSVQLVWSNNYSLLQSSWSNMVNQVYEIFTVDRRGNNTWKSNVADHLKDVLHSANHTPKIMFHNTCHLKVLMIEHTIMTHILPIMYQCKAFSSQHLEMWWTCKAQKV